MKLYNILNIEDQKLYDEKLKEYMESLSEDPIVAAEQLRIDIEIMAELAEQEMLKKNIEKK